MIDRVLRYWHAERNSAKGLSLRGRRLARAELLETRLVLNTAPIANADHYTIDEDQILFNLLAEAGVLANDTDAESDALSAILIDDVTHGALSFNANGSFVYAPNVDFHGTDAFTYAASDAALSATASVTIEVRSQYDPPFTAPDTYKLGPLEILAVDEAMGVLANDFSPEGTAITALLEDDVDDGILTLDPSGSFRYEPQGFSGTTTFAYRVSDGTSLSDAVTVTLAITDSPVARSDAYNLAEDELLLVPASQGLLANDSFRDDQSITAAVVQTTQNGSLALKPDGSFAYGPKMDFAGEDSFTYTITNGQELSDPVEVSIDIAPVNDAPIPDGDAYFTLTDQPLAVPADSGVLANDIDIEGSTILAKLVDPPEHGTLELHDDGAFVYTPEVAFTGDDQFTYRATDSLDESGVVQVRLSVAAQPLIISEVMANNATTLPTRLRADAEDRFRGEREVYDWIELQNLLSQPLPIGGFHLTDGQADPTKWQFPAATIIPAGGYLVVFASGKDIQDPSLDDEGLLHTNFSLANGGEYLAVTSVDGQTVFEFAQGYPEQQPDISYGHGSNDTEGYFIQPTPAAANVDARTGEVADTKFSVDRGIYDQPISVEITTATEGAMIRYTLDGTPPTETTGSVYTDPITISTTTTLRASAFKEGMLPADVDTQTYLFLDSVLRQSGVPDTYPDRWRSTTADYDMSQNSDDLPLIAGDPNYTRPEYEARIKESLLSLPTLSIVLPADSLFGSREGIYANPGNRGERWERAASVEFILPDASQGFQIDAGLRIMGGTTRNLSVNPKQSLRLLFKKQYGAGRLEYPLFDGNPVDSFNTLALRANTRDSWTSSSLPIGPRRQALFFRDQWAKVAQADTGQLAVSGRFVHLYLNGMYWGVYNPTERPDAAFAAEHLGGDDSDYDVVKFCCPDRVVDGDMDEWNELLQLARRGLESDEAYQRIQGNNPDGTRNEDYDVLIDVDNFIDYVISGQYSASLDWPGNYYVARLRGPDSEGFQFFTWDDDLAFPSLNLRANKVRPDPGHNWWTESPGEIDIAIRRNAEYRVRFADRVHMHLFNDGAFTTENATMRWNDVADSIETALIAESARWGDYRRDVAPANGERVLYTVQQHWRPTADRMLSRYFPERTETVIGQLRAVGLYPDMDAPVYLINGEAQHGGSAPAGASLTFGAQEGALYYTLDGSDPRLPGGTVSPTAIRYDGSIMLSDLTTVKSRLLVDDEWSALSDATFTVDTVPADAANLRITELAYHPLEALVQLGEPDVDADLFEFVELANVGPQPIDLGGVQLVETRVDDDSQGVTFVFETQTLAPGDRLVVAKDVSAFQARYGDTIRLAHGNDGVEGRDGQYGGNLSNGGERLTLLAPDGSVIQQFAFNDSDGWPTRADGDGSSLEIVDFHGDYSDPANWRGSAEFGGSPGHTGHRFDNQVVINEVLTNTDEPAVDLVELFNWSDAAVDIGGWLLSDTRDNYVKFTVPEDTSVPANGYLVFSETQLGFALNSTDGDDIWMIEADATGRPLQFVDHIEFGAAAVGVALGRWPNGTGSLAVMREPTLGRVNSGPVAPDWQAGDANEDGRFDQLDLVAVLQAGKYRTGELANWTEGDWNGDEFFDQLDIMASLQRDLYLKGPYRAR